MKLALTLGPVWQGFGSFKNNFSSGSSLVEQLLWWSWSHFKKYLAKHLLVLVSHGTACSHVSWLHLSSGSRKRSAASCLELLKNEPFGKAPTGARFGALPNRPTSPTQVDSI